MKFFEQQPLILALAPNGAYKNKLHHLNLPIKDQEIIEVCTDALKTGCIMVHLHIRDKDGKHSLDDNHYKKLLAKIREKTNDKIIIQITSEAAGICSAKEQISSIKKTKERFVSISLKEIMRVGKQEVHSFFVWMKNNDIHPQIILYDTKDAKKFYYLMEEKILVGKKFALLLVVGKTKTKKPMNDLKSIITIVKDFANSIMLCGFEQYEPKIVRFALRVGLDIRVGFENNLFLDNKKQAYNNTEILKQTINKIHLSERFTIANYQQTQKKLLTLWK
jgi:3-keto-5-aminohexanoate cleavage enzyme